MRSFFFHSLNRKKVRRQAPRNYLSLKPFSSSGELTVVENLLDNDPTKTSNPSTFLLQLGKSNNPSVYFAGVTNNGRV
jgi:hypothetical protein